MAFSLLPYSIAFGSDDNGADAHSPSMSVGSGEEPIAEESVTLEESDAENATEELVSEEDLQETVNKSEQASFSPTILIIAIPIVGIILWLLLRSKNKKSKKYAVKH